MSGVLKLQIARKEYSDAQASTKTAIQLDASHIYAYLVCAQALEQQGRADQAAQERNRAQEILNQLSAKDRNSPGLAVPLAIFVDDDPKEIVRLLEPAIPRLTSLERTQLATAYFTLGRPIEGEAEFQKVFEEPKWNTAQVHRLYAQLLQQAGWLQKAKRECSRAYEMDPENLTFKYEYEKLRQQAIQ
jgi:tetratricopeptide (TPR) repeat protein